MDINIIPSEREVKLYIKKKIHSGFKNFSSKRKEAKKYKPSLWEKIKNEAMK